MSRFIAQMILAGAQIFGRAFADAYRQAVANASRGGAAEAAGASTAARRGAMELDEAVKILNVDKDANFLEVLKKYDHLFKANEPSHGSFYLQSKVFRAKERLESEYNEEIRKVAEAEFAKLKQQEAPPPPSASSSSSTELGSKTEGGKPEH